MKRFYLFFAIFALAFVACEQDDVRNPEPELILTSAEDMRFSADGGPAVITYRLENPVKGVKVEASCVADWVTDLTVGETITFTVLANEAEQFRETEIVVRYGVDEDFDVDIYQDGKTVPAPTPDPELTLTSAEEMDFSADGGEGTITYQLENPVEGVEVEASCVADWVTNLTVGETITFTVLANETEQPRQAEIVVRYGTDEDFDVTVRQAAKGPDPQPTYDKEFTAQVLNGLYYGNAYSDAYNYLLTLSDNGLDDLGYVQPNSEGYMIDLYSSVAVGAGENVVPLGSYTFDPDDTMTAGTFSTYYSSYFTTDAEGELTLMAMVSGTLEVTENRMEMIVTLENGELHRVVYEGSLLFTYPEGTMPGGGISTLEEPYSFSIEGGLIQGENCGDYYEIGYDDWLITMLADPETGTGDCFLLELLKETGSTSLVGTYTLFDEIADSYADTFLPGEYELEDGYMYPYYSWYITTTEAAMDGKAYAPLVGGTIEIREATTEGNYEVILNCVDDNGTAISGTFEGTYFSYMQSQSMPLSRKANMRPSVLVPPMVK